MKQNIPYEAKINSLPLTDYIAPSINPYSDLLLLKEYSLLFADGFERVERQRRYTEINKAFKRIVCLYDLVAEE